MQIDGNLANVVQECGIGCASGPDFCLCCLFFGFHAGGQQVRLTQLEGVCNDLQAMVQHATGIGMVMPLRGREQLDQFGIALQWGQVQSLELSVGQRGALPDVFQQLLAAGRRQQTCGGFGPHQPFGHFRAGSLTSSGSQTGAFALEQREHLKPRTM